MARFRRVVLGGTFDRLHRGHEALLRTAFEAGRSVAIGLTSEAYLAQNPKPLGGRIAPYSARRAALARWLRRRYAASRWSIVPIDDRFGGSVGPGVDALVVSADSVAGGRAVNRERRRNGRPGVPLIVVPLVLADDLEPLSSRRIRGGAVDPNGRRRSPIRVGTVVADPRDRLPVSRAVRAAFPGAHVTSRVRTRGIPRTLGGTGQWARRAQRGRDLGVTAIRRPPGGWWVAAAGPHTVLNGRLPTGTTAAELTRGIARWLRPSARSSERGR